MQTHRIVKGMKGEYYVVITHNPQHMSDDVNTVIILDDAIAHNGTDVYNVYECSVKNIRNFGAPQTSHLSNDVLGVCVCIYKTRLEK